MWCLPASFSMCSSSNSYRNLDYCSPGSLRPSLNHPYTMRPLKAPTSLLHPIQCLAKQPHWCPSHPPQQTHHVPQVIFHWVKLVFLLRTGCWNSHHCLIFHTANSDLFSVSLNILWIKVSANPAIIGRTPGAFMGNQPQSWVFFSTSLFAPLHLLCPCSCDLPAWLVALSHSLSSAHHWGCAGHLWQVTLTSLAGPSRGTPTWSLSSHQHCPKQPPTLVLATVGTWLSLHPCHRISQTQALQAVPPPHSHSPPITLTLLAPCLSPHPFLFPWTDGPGSNPAISPGWDFQRMTSVYPSHQCQLCSGWTWGRMKILEPPSRRCSLMLCLPFHHRKFHLSFET